MSPKKPKPKVKIPKPPSFLITKHEVPPWAIPPPNFIGTKAEWAVYWALTKLQIEFIYQSPFRGGRQVLGGAVIDFFVPDYNLVIRVQGMYWHYERGQGVESKDIIQRLALESLGYLVIDINEDDALRSPLFYVKEALRGIDHSKN